MTGCYKIGIRGWQQTCEILTLSRVTTKTAQGLEVRKHK